MRDYPKREETGAQIAATSRRAAFVASAIGAAALLTSSKSLATQKLYVFAINDRRAHAVEKDLSDDMNGIAVTVFGRIADFVDGVTQGRPDAILAPELVLRELGVPPILHGTLAGDTSEQYALLSDQGHSMKKAQSIGAVDLLGRREMPALIQKLLSSSAPPKVVRVAKVEDLLPALTFKTADAVVLPSRLVGSLKSRTSMPLSVVYPDKARLGCLCAGGNNVSSVAPALRKLSRTTLSYLGVDGWR